MPRNLILHCRLSPGDVLTMTAAVESLHAQFSGQYRTDVRTTVAEIWQHNPHITPLADGEGEALDLEYGTIHRSDKVLLSFLGGYVRDLGSGWACRWSSPPTGRTCTWPTRSRPGSTRSGTTSRTIGTCGIGW
jgi:hypothetical protein